MDGGAAMTQFRSIVPSLSAESYKGQHGKVAVIGGCLEFTGAPYFAAMSALKVGADMAYVVCTPSARDALKSYSPELMVLPYLPRDEDNDDGQDGEVDVMAVSRSVSRIMPWIRRASAVVVGPGLGDHPAVCAAATALIREVRALGLPLLVDGSALTHIVAKDPSTVQGCRTCLLTPNVAELGRIASAVGLQLPGKMGTHWQEHARQVADAYNGPIIIAKGPGDAIVGPGGAAAPSAVCNEQAALRRCGGQGDVLAGTAAAFLCWAAKHSASAPAAAREHHHHGAADAAGAPVTPDALVACAFVACTVMRRASFNAFKQHERSMLAGDIIPLLYPSFKEVLGRR